MEDDFSLEGDFSSEEDLPFIDISRKRLEEWAALQRLPPTTPEEPIVVGDTPSPTPTPSEQEHGYRQDFIVGGSASNSNPGLHPMEGEVPVLECVVERVKRKRNVALVSRFGCHGPGVQSEYLIASVADFFYYSFGLLLCGPTFTICI